MGAVWLTDLDDWLAEEFAPDEFSTYPGWLTRSRSTGGYEAVWAIGTHHTASGAPSANQMRYEWVTATDGPIGAIHLAKNGHITIGAAGATNTQGKGGPVTTSKGIIPRDKGNLYMLSIEAANDGVGESWPDVQVRNYVRLVAVLCRKLDLDPARDVFSHAGWCAPSTPGRKVDPAGPTPSEPVLGGAAAPPVRTWPDSEFRALTVAELTPPPPPPVKEDDMSFTDEDRKVLNRIREVLLDDDKVMPGYPSMWTMINQSRTVLITTLWDKFPEVISGTAGFLTRTVKRLAESAGVASD